MALSESGCQRWSDRKWLDSAHPTTRRGTFETRLAVAEGNWSVAGAWLGFHAATGPIALVIVILAAVAGATLVLILLDMASSADDRISADTAQDTRSASRQAGTPTGAAMR